MRNDLIFWAKFGKCGVNKFTQTWQYRLCKKFTYAQGCALATAD
jgi:hypothetical protein